MISRIYICILKWSTKVWYHTKKLPYLESKKFFYINSKTNKLNENKEKISHFKLDKLDFSGETNKMTKHVTIDAIPTNKARNVKTLSDFFYSQQNINYKSNNESNKNRMTQYETTKYLHSDKNGKKN